MSRRRQITFAIRALARDVVSHQWVKLSFHFRGLLRAVGPQTRPVALQASQPSR